MATPKPTTIKEALKRWEEKHQQDISEATDVGLQFQWPPIEKMDSHLSVLKHCLKLSLSTNMIDKLSGLGTLKNLRILCLSRNYLKKLDGIEGLGDTLEELWVSYNLIDKLKALESLKKVKVLYIGNNMIKDWNEFNRINSLPNLEELLFLGNPLALSMDESLYKAEVVKRLTNIKELDGETVIRD